MACFWGLVLGFLSSARYVGLFYLVGMPVGFVLYRADAPFPIVIEEVLSVFRFLWEPASCNC